jgi:predicted nuclease with TOPRIM domain
MDDSLKNYLINNAKELMYVGLIVTFVSYDIYKSFQSIKEQVKSIKEKQKAIKELKEANRKSQEELDSLNNPSPRIRLDPSKLEKNLQN